LNFTLDYSVKQFLVEGRTEIPPFLINPFLRVMETMEKTCTVMLKYGDTEDSRPTVNGYENTKKKQAYYEVTPGV